MPRSAPLLLLLALPLAGCASLGAGGFSPALELMPVDQHQDLLRASDLNGRVVVVTFIDPTCQRCHPWLRMVEEAADQIAEERQGEGGEQLVSLYVIGGPVARGGDPRPAARAYLTQHGLTHDAYWDRQRLLSVRVRDAENATYVFDREGRVVYRQSNTPLATAAAARRLEAAIVRALGSSG